MRHTISIRQAVVLIGVVDGRWPVVRVPCFFFTAGRKHYCSKLASLPHGNTHQDVTAAALLVIEFAAVILHCMHAVMTTAHLTYSG